MAVVEGGKVGLGVEVGVEEIFAGQFGGVREVVFFVF